MIKKIKSIKEFAVFNDFDWDKEPGNNNLFRRINILYGRNGSGKTMLSRILRSMETGKLPDTFENSSFEITFYDEPPIDEKKLTDHSKKIRVFNEDFVRDNLRFITDPDDSIKAFAILGSDNSRIEEEIKKIQKELGLEEEEKETGLYAKRKTADTEYKEKQKKYHDAVNSLENQLKRKAKDIKHKVDRFGEVIYDVRKIRDDIKTTSNSTHPKPTEEKIEQYGELIKEEEIPSIPAFQPPPLTFQYLVSETENLVTEEIIASDKIEKLVKEADLNRWVQDGLKHHKKGDKCGFCDNPISEGRWEKLKKHFDKKSEQLEKNIKVLIGKISTEKNAVSSTLSFYKNQFYSTLHKELAESKKKLETAIGEYEKSLDVLTNQLNLRQKNILNQQSFERQHDTSKNLIDCWGKCQSFCDRSAKLTTTLRKDQADARRTLRLKEVSDFAAMIDYEGKVKEIKGFEEECKEVKQRIGDIQKDIDERENQIALQESKLSDEGEGAKKINEYLDNFFGHPSFRLKATQDEITNEDEKAKQIYFEVTRNGEKAYNLSEGECRLLAFCYFLAKLDDTETRDSKPIIWIDDPVSSLDGNHVFFVYSLLNTEIVRSGKFEQLFVSTHNLNFLRYLIHLKEKKKPANDKDKEKPRNYFFVVQKGQFSTIEKMPKYLREYATEFNYLFQQIYECARIKKVNDKNFHIFYNFANNARKFLEIYLYYKYPDPGTSPESSLKKFLGEDIHAALVNRISNEYSHLKATFERGLQPVDEPEMQKVAERINNRLKKDKEQYDALLRSIGVKTEN